MCKQNFPGKSELEKHIASTHMNVKYSCIECDQTFTSESGMKIENFIFFSKSLSPISCLCTAAGQKI